jgi:hypothetical protein
MDLAPDHPAEAGGHAQTRTCRVNGVPLLHPEPGNLTEASLFGTSALGVGWLGAFAWVHLSVPPAHRSEAMLRRDLAMTLAVVSVVALLGSLAFGLAQDWRRKQDLLFPRNRWLPVALGAAYPPGFVLGVQGAQWVARMDDPWWLLWIVGLGLPVLLSRLAWRSAEPV